MFLFRGSVGTYSEDWPLTERRGITMVYGFNKAATALALALMLAAGSASAGKLDSIVLIRNQSNWDIHQLYLSPTEDTEWGPDQLGQNVISSGGTFQLHKIPCNEYDVRLVDEDGDICVIGGVSLCADEGAWEITNEALLACQEASK